MSKATQRRLAAIVSADVVGYSRLMGIDESGTHTRLQERYSNLVVPLIAAHSGRVVKLMGDGLLVEFFSVIAAVDWAIECQTKFATLNTNEPDDQKIEYRIGVNIGDVIVDGDDIFGDGVNVAARLQEMAKPGGVCISAKVYSEIVNQPGTIFIDGGEQVAKNIAQPIHIWHWLPDGKASFSEQFHKQTQELTLPEKPSIAVLPFDNMSGDPEQEFFVDGVVEDILTTLSKIPALFVIARNSSFKYKGQSIDLRDVGRELGVRYVVEGSIRKAGNRVRVTAQLVDCFDGKHVWAERYDGELDDVFDLQDRITKEIVTQLEINLTEGEQVNLWRERSGSPLVYEKYIKGRDLYLRFSKQTHSEACNLLETALEINPAYTPAMVLLGYTFVDQARLGWVQDRLASYEKAELIGAKAIAADPDYGLVHTIMSYAFSHQEKHGEAVLAAEKAVALSPNDASAFHMSAITHIYAGNFIKGRDYELQASRMSPMDLNVFRITLATAQYHLSEFDEARKISKLVLIAMPQWLTAQTILVSSLWRLNRKDEAKILSTTIIKNYPNFSVDRWSKGHHYLDSQNLIKLMEPLLEAGLPN